ncbi:T9SS type A sorting domain-containing protein [Dyadobacter sp. NIV53]|uniref:T9SS type A sorting domain-containing protein n=1 Tax=Dyadobacter sp. NIV53 TaxID=2861765 RepID=UPI001C8709EA|nr:T9SS type A sorting domain-containing protein [Dyadobacter sp. NIV53]
MKNILILSAFLGLGGITCAQTPALINNGAGLFISQGTEVQVNGDFINEPGSDLNNKGIISTSGDVVNNVPMLQADAGELFLQGTQPQTIAGAPVYATNLTISNPAGVTFTTPVRISGQIAFASGILVNTDPANAITFTTDASVSEDSPASDASHINGFVVKEGVGGFNFPTGDGQSYQPVSVNLTENSDGMMAKYVAGDAGTGDFSNTGSNPTPLLARNAQEYWTLLPAGTAAGTVSIFWDNYNNSGIGNTADLAVAHLIAGKWQNEGASSSSGTSAAGVVTSNSISTWSPFTLGSISASSPLPVRLISFTAKRVESTVVLKWKIADAERFSHFEVQRSIDAVQYEKAGRIDYLKSGSAQSDFDFTDFQSAGASWLAGKLYYRLKLVDLDGSYAYSKAQSVEAGSHDMTLVAYPNPAREVLNLRTGSINVSKAEITITSLEGKRLMHQPVSVIKGKVTLDTHNFPPGVYLLSVRQDGYDQAFKFIKE